MLTYLLLFFLSLCLSYLSILAFSKLFYKFDILDNPKKYWKKRKAIPYGMGVIFFLVFFIVSAFFVDLSYKLLLIWIFWAVITFLSFIDDRLNVSAKIRLIVQIIIGITIGLTSIKIGYVSNIFWGVIDLTQYNGDIFGYTIYYIPLLFTVIWYVFVFNALNWTDGIQGNTSGLSLICFFVIFLLGFRLYLTDDYAGGVQNATFIMKLSLILVGVLIPFFFFDVREKILMGDSGTMFLGFMLATLAIISGGKIATVLAVFGIYAVDAVYVIVRRISRWKNPMKGDFTHLHHRLHDIGLSGKQILTLIFSLSFFFGVTALFLDRTGKIIVFAIISVFVLFLSYVGRNIKKISFKK